MHIQEEVKSFYIPNKKIITQRKTLRRIIRGDQYLYERERDLNCDKGERGYQIRLFTKNFEWYHYRDCIKYFWFKHESDVIDFHIEINDPNFNWEDYDVDYRDIDKTLLLLTQALTANPGVTQSFAIPDTWGRNTCSCIGGGGNGSQGYAPGEKMTGGGGGGSGALAASNIQNVNRNGSVNYFIGSQEQSTWFNSSGILLADGATSANTNQSTIVSSPGSAGTAGASVGSVKFSGANGGNTNTITIAQNQRGSSTGGTGASAANPSGNGTAGNNGNTIVDFNSATQNGVAGANSSTATGGTAGSGTGGNGGNGTDFGSVGSGAGGASGGVFCLQFNTPSATAGGAGGFYGAGGGGGSAAATENSGGAVLHDAASGNGGRQGLIFLSWVPFEYTEIYST